MNKDEIKKALECCSKNDVSACKGCPYNAKSFSLCADEQMCKDALALITEQDKEIERLKANGYRSIMYAFENNRDKIVENIQTEIDDYKQSIKQAKIDVLNEVKERAIGLAAIETYHICNLIDELIKEVQNGEDKG